MNLPLHLLLAILAINVARAQVTEIIAGSLFNAETGRMDAGPFHLFVQNNAITAILPTGVARDDAVAMLSRDGVRIAAVVNLTGSYVLPGLIDTHVHLLLRPYNETSWDDQLVYESVELRVIRAVTHMAATLLAGFTAVRDLGTEGALHADQALKQAAGAELVPSPRLFISSKAIVCRGCYPPRLASQWGQATAIGAEEADGVEEVRRVVRSQLSHDADVIKMYGDYPRVSARQGDDVVMPEEEEERQGKVQRRRRAGQTAGVYPLFTFEEFQVAAQEAAVVGVPLAVHAYDDAAAMMAIRAGAKSIEHGNNLSEEAFALMIEYGCSYVPTLAVVEALALYNPTEGNLARLEQSRETFQLAVAMGVPIVMGSDAGAFTHGKNQREIELMVEYGMPAGAALQSATVLASQLLSPSLKAGLLQVGYLADIVAVDRNPLEDIFALRDVTFVMKNGVIYKQPAQ